ncbi:DUF4494 domain-containing protein [Xylanibacter oryzae]|uniref:DUF4494 domain-containing protein n=1 Tax=Xylanibacter oryzae TaxID=185293 RepID=UPI0004BABB81|nr:DUF4494 domain-containing protein [Xylanibacter oryzae]
MRSRTDNWFECKIKYEKMQEDGTQKKVTEQYTVDALSFTEAEKRIMEEMSSYISGAFEVSDIKKASYKEVFFADLDSADKWYKTKVQFITIDEKTAKEKRSNVYYLVNAGSFKGAVNSVIEFMGQGTIDYSIAAINETAIMDVYEYGKTNYNDKPEYEEAK